MGRRALALLVATVVALVGVVALLTWVRSADQRAVAGQEPTAVYVTTAKVAAGTPLGTAVDDGLIAPTTVATKGAPAGALRTVTPDSAKLVAVTDIAPGEFVLSARFATTPEGTSAIAVPRGKVAVSVQLEDPARVGTFVTPGSHIAIFDTYTVKALGDSDRAKQLNDADVRSTSVLLGDVLVIGMGQSALSSAQGAGGTGGADAPADSGSPASFLVTVAVSPADAARLVHAVHEGSLYAALRGAGARLGTAPRVDDLNLFDLSGVGR